MRQFVRLAIIGVVVSSAGVAARGAGGTFQVTNAAAASGHYVDNITEARQLLAGQMPARAFVNTFIGTHSTSATARAPLRSPR